MATMGYQRFNIISALFFVIFISFAHRTSSKEMPVDLETVGSSWVTALDNDLARHMQNSPLFTVINSYFQSDSNSGSRTDLGYKVVESQTLVKKMAVELAEMLNRKKLALTRLVEVAEDAAANYTWDGTLTKDTDVMYYNSKDPTILEPLLGKGGERFEDKEINATISSVHIPVEIYEGDIDILNGLKWSEKLDAVFEENYENDSEILWQYFGSQTGFMRTFPASLWGTPPDAVDLYDVRRRPWYTQGSSSPKDMLILIDRSGSVHGQSLQLIKVAVKSILDTLGENDFVKIVQFSKTAENVSCFDKFVQANYRNKMILSKAVDKLVAKEMANFKVGLKKAFDDFDELDKGNFSARCNRMIMLLTDGGTDSAEAVYKERNWSRKASKQIRVFTYAVGQISNPVKDIRWMACANRGRFSEIPAMGAIRARVQEHVEVIARPLALKHIEMAKWTSSYTGSYRSREYGQVLSQTFHVTHPLWTSVYQDKTGLGMMTTVTLPVYNRTKGASNQTILGVMGIDVTTKQMEKFSPTWLLGPNGYTFAINTNGYVIFHPKLKVQGYLKDPPNMDFLDIEVENEKKTKLRKNMIDRLTGLMNIETYIVSPDQRHVDEEVREYAYTDINGTTFSLGLSVPSYQQYVPVINVKMSEIVASKEKFNIKNTDTSQILLAPWNYFNQFRETNGTLEDIYAALQAYDNYTWNEEKMKHLFWDLKLVSHVNNYFKDVPGEFHKVQHNIYVLSFFSTYGGLTQVFPKSNLTEFQEGVDTWKAKYFRRALDSEQYIYSVPQSPAMRTDNDTLPEIKVVKSITMSSEVKGQTMKFKPAVVGAYLDHKTLVEMMESATDDNEYLGCKDSHKVQCYLLDDGAFLIATNQDNRQIGQFFRDVDIEIMAELYNQTYDRLEQYDFQGTCKIITDNSSSAGISNFRIPSINLFFDFLTVNWWNSIWTWSLVNFNIYNWFTPQAATASEHEGEKYKSCIKKQAQYYFKEGFTSGTWQMTPPCNNNCSRDFFAKRLKYSNLLFIMAYRADCPVCDEGIEVNLIQEPKEDAGPDFCHMMPRYRQNPEKCYDFNKDENDVDCSGPYSRPVSKTLIILASLTTLFMPWFFTPR